MKRAIPRLMACLIAFIALSVVVGSPYADSADDAYVALSLYVGIPVLLITSAFGLASWWKTQIKGEPLPRLFEAPWKKRMKVVFGWLDWL